MGSLWLFAVTSFLLAGSLSGQDTNLISGCLWDNLHSLSCPSAGITVLQDGGQDFDKPYPWPRSPRSLKTIKHINLSNNMISSLNLKTFYKFLSLETLNVSNNYISMVSLNYELERPKAILSSLHTLVIDRNKLTFVPKGIGKLRSLQTLDLSANSITRIQRVDFANCSRLQSLDLGDNRIHKIDADAFRDLRKLQVLRLSNNALVSITPLVFLYSHVLRADIDVSYNRWACDCRILPLRNLLTSLPVDMKTEWNVTCSSPLSMKGSHLQSIDHMNGSCETSKNKYINARRIVFKKGEISYLTCDIKDQTGYEEIFWWTPQGFISRESSATNHYIDIKNNLILKKRDHSHEGLYICMAGIQRIVYEVYFQSNAGEASIRKRRDVQLLNTRVRAEEDFARAVSLSVVITFICAFILGVFLRPCLVKLWRKLCTSIYSKKKTSEEAYDNEGFSEENVSTRNSVHVPKDNSSESDMGFEEPNNTEYVNVTYNEREIYYNDEQAPTHSELQGRSDTYEEVEEVEAKHKDSQLPNTKRVSWASDEDNSPKVNLKLTMSLLKPINIVSETQIEYKDNHNQSINVYDDVFPKKNRGSFSNTSSDGSEFWDAEELLSDDDIIPKAVSTQHVGSASNGHIIPTVNLRHVLSLLKPIKFIVFEPSNPEIGENHYENPTTGSSQLKYINHDVYDSSSSSEEDISEDDVISITRTTKEDDSPKVNLKHIISLLKPINIIVPEFTTYDIVKSPTQKQIFPIPLPRYSKNKNESSKNEDIKLSGVSNTQHQKDNINKKSLYDSSSSSSGAEDGKETYHSSSSDDGSIDFDYSSDEGVRLRPVLPPRMQVLLKNKSDSSHTVNLGQIISLLKPIKIVAPSPTPVIHDEDGMKFIDSSSSDEGSEFDYSSDEEVRLSPILPLTQPASWTNNTDTNPTVNLQQVISLLKPINIIDPEYKDNGPSLRPTDREAKPMSSDSSSSDNDSMKGQSSDEENIIPSIKEETLASQVSPTVNLRHVMSLIKPIAITIPETRNIDQIKKPTQSLIFPGSIPIYPKNRVEYPENLYHYQDIKPSGQLENKPPKYESYDKIATFPVSDGEEKKTLHDSSSSDTEGDSSGDEIRWIPRLPSVLQTSWTSNIDSRPTVNLQQVISLLKPIKVISPEFDIRFQQPTETEYQSPNPTNDMESKEISSDSSSSDNESTENHSSTEEGMIPSVLLTKQETLPKQQNVIPTVNLKHEISLINPINITFPEFPKRPSQTQFLPGSVPKYEGGDLILSTVPPNINKDKQTFHDSSSSEDESKDHSSDEGSIKSYDVPITRQPSLAGKGNESPKVNLRQAMSLLKPISILGPDYSVTTQVGSPSQEQFFPTGGTNYEAADFVLSTVPPKIHTDKHTFHDSSSSEDESKEDDDHSSDDRSFKSYDLPITQQPSWAEKGNESPKVNLKQVMSLLKPITILAPGHTVAELIGSSPQEQIFPIGSTHNKTGDIILSTVPPKINTDKQTFHDSSSSEDESKEDEDHSSDEGNIKSYDLPITQQPSWARKRNESPKVNLKQVMSLLKPIRILGPDYSVTKPVGSPSHEQFFPIGGANYGDFILSTVPPNINKDKQTVNDSSSSEDEDHRSDEESIKSYPNLHITQQPSWAGKGEESPTVNLKQVMSLLKPISILAATVPELVERSPQEHIFPTGSTHNKTGGFILSTVPPNDGKDKQTLNDSSSSEDESKEDEDQSSDEGSYDLTITQQPSWTGQVNESPKVNLKQVMSLLKPITILAPGHTVTELVGSSPQEQFFPTGSTSYEAEDVILSSIKPNDGKEKQTFNDSSSSEDESKKDEDQSSDEGSITSYDFLLNEQKSYKTLPSPTGSNVNRKSAYDSSSSSSEEEGNVVPCVPPTNPAIRTSKVTRPSFNLKQVMSLVKPIHVVSESTTNLRMYYPHNHQYNKQYEEVENQPQYPNYEKHNVEILTGPIKHKIQYDSTSSDDGSKMENSNRSSTGDQMKSESMISLGEPLHVKATDNTVTEALRRFKEKYNTEVHGHQTVNQFVNTSSGESYVDKPNSPKNIQDSDASKGNTKLITWQYDESYSSKVNLKQKMSLLKPINIIAPDSPSIVVTSPEQKYIVNMSQPGNTMENTGQQNDQDKRIYRGNSTKQLHKTSFKDPNSSNSYYNRSETSQILYKGEIKHSAHPKPKEASTSPKLNLKHVISLFKPINIVVPDATSMDTIENPTKTLLAERLSHNTISEYYTDTLHDSSSEDGSFFSFSQSNSSDTEAISRDVLGGLKRENHKSKANPNLNLAQRDEGLKDIAGGEYGPNKTKAVLHWLKANTSDEPKNTFSASKTSLSAQNPERELVLDLNTQQWTTRTIARNEALAVPSYESQTSANKTYFLPDFGETSTDASLQNSEESSPPLDIKIQNLVLPSVDHPVPKHHGRNYTNRRKVFDAFSDSLKEEPV